MGHVHGRHYSKMPNVELLVFDRDMPKAYEYARSYNATACKSAQELIGQADMVDNCLPSDLHTEFALRSIAEGKPTLVEKPLAKTLEEGEKIVEAGLFALYVESTLTVTLAVLTLPIILPYLSACMVQHSLNNS